MRSIPGILIGCLLAITVNAQQSAIDSLERLLKLEKTDSGRIDLLTQLAKRHDDVDTAKAAGYYQQMKAIAEASGNEIFLGYANEMAGILATRYDQKKARAFYNTALEQLSRNQQSLRVKRSIASLNNNLGVIHYLNGDLEGALKYFMHAVRFYEEFDSTNWNCGYGYGNISTTYADLQKPDHAVVYSRKALQFAERSGNQNLLMSAEISHGSNLLKAGKYDDAVIHLERAKQIAVDLKNNYNLNLYYSNLGEHWYKQKDYRRSLEYYAQALIYARIMNTPGEIGYGLLNTGICHYHLGEFKPAKLLIDSAEQIAFRHQLKVLEQNVYDAQSEWSERTGDYKRALAYRNRFIALRDSAYAEENIKRVEFLDAQYQAEKKEKDILSLQSDKQIQALKLRQRSTLNYILAGSVVALVLVGFLVFRNLRHRRRLEQQQQEIQLQRIRDLEKDRQLVAVDSMLKGQEEERSRLAKDLHDGLGGLLSGVKFSLINMKDNLIVTPENMSVFERSLDMLDTSIRELRRVAHNMMPEMLDKFGLDEALKEYCNSINGAGLLDVKYQSHGMNNRVNKQAEIIIYRIIQELLNNILKHAEAKNVFIQLIREDTRLNVVVEDNGKGFDTALAKGAGLLNIRSRVEYLKGQLDIHSAPGKGTLVNIELNLES